MEICHKRIVAAHKASKDGQILRNVDAAILTFDMHDHEAVIKEIQGSHTHEVERQQFGSDYMEYCG